LICGASVLPVTATGTAEISAPKIINNFADVMNSNFVEKVIGFISKSR